MESIKLLAENVILVAAVITAILGIVAFIKKCFTPFEQITLLEEENKELRLQVDEKEKAIIEKHDRDIKAIQKEQTLVTFGVLACLKGLKEQGCNGSVTEAIDKIEKHLNEMAHNQGE